MATPAPLAFPLRVLYSFQSIGFRDQLWPCSEIRTSKRQLSDEWLVKALSMSTPALAAGSVTSSFRWSTAWDDDQSLKRHAFKSHHFFRRGVKTASRSKQQISSKANQPESSCQSLSPHMFCKKVFWISSHQPFQSNNYALFVCIESLWRRWSISFRELLPPTCAHSLRRSIHSFHLR